MKSIFIFLFSLCVANFFFAENVKQDIDLGTIVTYINSDSQELYFSQEQIQDSNAKNLADFLSSKNCLVMNTGGLGSSANISIRGYAGACIKVYVDGVLANDPNTGEFDWNSIPLESIVSIKIQDSLSLGQEQFSGSAISISTKSYSSRKLSVSFENLAYDTSPFDTQFYNCIYQDLLGKTAFKLSLSGTKAKNQYLKVDSSILSDQKFVSYGGSFSWNRYINSHSIGSSHAFTLNNVEVPASLTPFGRQKTTFFTNTFQTNLDFPFGYTQLKFTYDLDNLDFKVPSDNSENSKNIFHSLTLQLNQTHYSIPLKFGEFDPAFSVKTSFIYGDFQLSTDSNFSPKRFLIYPSFLAKYSFKKLKIESVLGYLFLQDSISKTKSIFHQINAAISFEFANIVGFSASTQNALPTFNQLFWNYSKLENKNSNEKISYHGNPNLKPESGYSLRLKFIPLGLSVGMSYYQNKIRWINGYYSEQNFISMFPENSSAAYYFDGTLSMNKVFSLPNSFSVGYDFLFSATKSFLLDREVYGNQIMWVPFFVLNSKINFGYKNVYFDIKYDFTSRRYTSNYNTSYYSPIHLLSFSFSIKAKENLTFLLSGENLLDQRYFYHDNYSAPSRSYSIKIKYTF